MTLRLPALVLSLSLLSLSLACGDKDGQGDDSGPGDGGGGADGGGAQETDADNDGVSVEDGDCDDADPAIHPGANELCNGEDEDCDEAVDEGFGDQDNDDIADCLDVEECDGIDNDGNGETDEGFGDSDDDGTDDCQDVEECDGLDNDGDKAIDEGFDQDGDGSSLCDPVPDCDDEEADRSPDQLETAGDGVDNDCDQLVDEGFWRFGDLVITELMVNPAAVSDPSGEWFEVMNASSATLYLDGLTIVSDGDLPHQIVSDEVMPLAPGAAAVLALQADPDVNGRAGGVYDYAGISLSNEGDTLALYAGDVQIDAVAYGGETGLEVPSGASLIVDVLYLTADENDLIESWCPSSYAWVAGGDFGSPGDPGQYCSIIDHDGDGYWVDTGDCDDGDRAVYPGAADTWYDGVDGNCDLLSDYDMDYDGYDSDSYGGDDCDDAVSVVNPGMYEVCDDAGVDEDCNGLANSADPGVTESVTYYRDGDGDGYGTPADTREACDPVSGFSTTSGDCNDSDDTVYPDAPDTWYDGTDSDCARDDDFDADADGFTSDAWGGDDCDDTHAEVNPDAFEVCDDEGLDEDCNGFANSEDPGVTESITYYLDNDDDGYGTDADTREGCDPIPGYADEGGDCDDEDETRNPGATENWYDGDDADCDGWNDYDADRDGFAHEDYDGIDCDDEDAAVWPYNWEDDTDGVDNDCDGFVDTLDPDEPESHTFGDDDYDELRFSSFTFDMCGTTYSSGYLTSNGLVTFGSTTTTYTESASAWESLGFPAVGMLWDDLYPPTGGMYYTLEHDGAFAVYADEVPEITSGVRNSWTTVLLPEGHFFTSYDTINVTDGLVGWTCGNRGGDFTTIDMTTAMEDVYEGAFGVGSGTEDGVYEAFSRKDNDLDDLTVMFCGTAGDDADGDGYTDLCGDPDDTDGSVIPY